MLSVTSRIRGSKLTDRFLELPFLSTLKQLVVVGMFCFKQGPKFISCEFTLLIRKPIIGHNFNLGNVRNLGGMIEEGKKTQNIKIFFRSRLKSYFQVNNCTLQFSGQVPTCSAQGVLIYIFHK